MTNQSNIAKQNHFQSIENQDQLDYVEGARVANSAKRLSRKHISKLKSSIGFWEGFHDNRPHSKLPHPVLEDPTRSGGWCVRN